MRIFRYVFGRIRFSVKGDFAERFYNLIIAQGLSPYDLCRLPDGAIAMSLPMRQFKKIRSARTATRVRIRVLEKYGLPRLLHRYRHRLGLPIGLAVFGAVVVLMSCFVWSIRFEGEIKDEAVLLSALKEAGLHEGSWRAVVDTDAVEQALLGGDLGLNFVSVVMKGSVAQVQISYASPKPDMMSTAPCNIVAKKDGVITYMMVKEGKPVVEEGDAVLKGELLISGLFDNMRQVHAQGHIYAKTNEKITVSIPYQSESQVATGNRKNRYRLRLFNFSINLYFGGGIPYAMYDKIESTKDLAIGEFILPISVVTHTYLEKKTVAYTVTPEQAQAAAEEMLTLKEQQQFFGYEYLCLGKTVTQQKDRCVITGEYEWECDIAEALPIS